MNKMELNDVSLSISVNDIDAFHKARESQMEIVKANPFLEVVDFKSFEEAKKRRTALRKGRYDLQNGWKLINDRLNGFKADVKAFTQELIDITRPHESRQQMEIERYEEEKRLEREAAEAAERERVQRIRKEIMEFRTVMSARVKSASLNTIAGVMKDIEWYVFKHEELKDDFECTRGDLFAQAEMKSCALEELERVRLMQEELHRESRRMVELKKYDYVYEGDGLGRMSEQEYLRLKDDRRKELIEERRKREAEVSALNSEREMIEMRWRELENRQKEVEAMMSGFIQEEVVEVDLRSEKERMLEAVVGLVLPEVELVSPVLVNEWELIVEELRCFVIEKEAVINSL